jgi:hypothetical protein
MLKSKNRICWTSNKRFDAGRKIRRSAKCNGKDSMEIVQKCHYQFGERGWRRNHKAEK